jgi:hypothetical protein
MSRARVLRLFAGASVAAVVALAFLQPAFRAEAQPPRAAPKWEYATLEYHEPIADVGADVSWIAGKVAKGAKSEKYLFECLTKLNKELGGQEEKADIGVLLDRIGQDGWELVTHTRADGPGGASRTWTFKRPAR